jgi:ferric-dicitrate binding protein FerR (iron transport regulator)
VPADNIDTKWLISHIDGKFEASERSRQDGFRTVHEKLSAQGEQITRIDTTLSKHITESTKKFEAIEQADRNSDDRRDVWVRTGLTSLVGGGSIAALIEWFRNGGRP